MSVSQPYPGSPVQTYPNGKPMFDASGRPASPKSRLAALLLMLIIGLGLHRFYVGKWGTGLLYLVTLGGLGIWVIVDLVMIIMGSFTDKQGRVVANW
jgi:TM2 domain-containing membrane protein YozV